MAKNNEDTDAKQSSKPQDSTTRIPMVDIESAITLAENIRDKSA